MQDFATASLLMLVEDYMSLRARFGAFLGVFGGYGCTFHLPAVLNTSTAVILLSIAGVGEQVGKSIRTTKHTAMIPGEQARYPSDAVPVAYSLSVEPVIVT